MISVTEWRRLILQFFVDRSGYSVFKVSKKEEIFDNFATHLDVNAEIAFISLINDGLILHCTSNGDDYYIIDLFDRLTEIKTILNDEKLDTDSEMMKPDESETAGLKHIFTEKSYRDYPNQSTYYYYVKEEDDSYWICLIKTKPYEKANKIILGSLRDPSSRIYRIWQATKTIANTASDGWFRRKQVEDIEQKACGNNRLPSKAAFDVFMYKKWLVNEKRGRSAYYNMKTIKSEKESKSESVEDEYQKKFTDDERQ